jgi:four helix bundle protein
MAFEELDVWKRSARLSAEIYKATAKLKDFGFRDQLTRSGLFVPSKIAEGMERDSTADTARFLTIAKASCAEMMTQVYIGIDIGYIESGIGHSWIRESTEINAMLGGLIKHYRNKSNS